MDRTKKKKKMWEWAKKLKQKQPRNKPNLPAKWSTCKESATQNNHAWYLFVNHKRNGGCSEQSHVTVVCLSVRTEIVAAVTNHTWRCLFVFKNKNGGCSDKSHVAFVYLSVRIVMVAVVTNHTWHLSVFHGCGDKPQVTFVCLSVMTVVLSVRTEMVAVVTQSWGKKAGSRLDIPEVNW